MREREREGRGPRIPSSVPRVDLFCAGTTTSRASRVTTPVRWRNPSYPTQPYPSAALTSLFVSLFFVFCFICEPFASPFSFIYVPSPLRLSTLQSSAILPAILLPHNIYTSLFTHPSHQSYLLQEPTLLSSHHNKKKLLYSKKKPLDTCSDRFLTSAARRQHTSRTRRLAFSPTHIHKHTLRLDIETKDTG